MRYLSPLRYPGGKGSLAPYIAALLRQQRPRPSVYVEPFAGGAGAALRLLRDEVVDEIIINDLDPGIAAFWRAVLDRTEELVELIASCDVSVDAWYDHRQRYADGDGDDLELGFAAFFLNRTNRSGILGARPIGGLDQTGKWKIDARFNRDDLTERVAIIAKYASRIEVCEQDGLSLLRDRSLAGSFIYVDPPYLVQGADLYLDTLRWDDHVALAQLLRSRHNHWIVTYDADDRVRQLYPTERSGWFDIAHTAAIQHIGKEFVVYSEGLTVTSLDGISTAEAGWHDPASAAVAEA